MIATRESPEDPTDGNDTDNDVFRSGSESPQFTLPVIPADAKQRRATVSGGSPTFERSSLVTDDLDTSGSSSIRGGRGHGLGHGHSLDPPYSNASHPRPKSQAINAQEKEAAIAALLAAAGEGGVAEAFALSLSPKKKDDGNRGGEKKNSAEDVENAIAAGSDAAGNSETSDHSHPPAESHSASEAKSGDATVHASHSSGVGGTSDDTAHLADHDQPQAPPTVKHQQAPKPTPRKSLLATSSYYIKKEPGEGLHQDAPEGGVVKDAGERGAGHSGEDSVEGQDDSVADGERGEGSVAIEKEGNVDETSGKSSQTDKDDEEGSKKESAHQDAESVTLVPEFSDKPQDFTIHKPTPVLRQNALGDSDGIYARRGNRDKIISTEVAGDGPRGGTPRLKRVKRLDSQQASDMEPKTDDDEVFDKPQKKVGFEDVPESYTHIVVGGVVQKIPVDKSKQSSSTIGSSAVKMRPKTNSKTKLDRRVSCKDLGRGDCEGWLYKRKQKDRTLSKTWDKRWCVLKHQDLYYYKQRDALKAEGLIHLPAFQVSPATNLKTKKFAFKIHNAGTTFYFASERQEDMSKWMNKLGLAAIKFETTSKDVNIGGFTRPAKSPGASGAAMETKTADYSESEEEGEDLPDKDSAAPASLGSMSSLASSSGSLASSNSPLVKRHRLKDVQETIGASTEELQAMLRAIQTQDLTIDGKDKTRQRRSQCSATPDLVGQVDHGEMEHLKKLHSLQRTLKAKELQLQLMDNLMKNPGALRDLQDFVDISEATEGANSDNNSSASPKQQ